MTIFSSKLEVFQAAMPIVGANVPASLDDQSAEAICANAIYEVMVKAELESFAWSFSTKEDIVTYQGETDSLPAYAYTLPADIMTPRAVLKSGVRFRDFEMRSGKLLCNLFEADDLTVVYTWRSPESEWTAKFCLGIVNKLAAYIALGLLDREDQGMRLDQKGDRLIRMAKRANRNTFKGADINPEPSLISAWKGTLGRPSLQGLAAISIGPNA